MDENYDRVVEHEQWSIEDGGYMRKDTVERQFVDGTPDHGPYNRVFHCTYIDGELVKEDIVTEPLEYSFDYYMDKMMVRKRPTNNSINRKDTVLAIEPYSKRKSEFIAKDEMLL